MTEHVRCRRDAATTPFTPRSLEMTLVRRARQRAGRVDASTQGEAPSWHVLQFLPWILAPHTVLWPGTGMGRRTCSPFVLRARPDGPRLASLHEVPSLDEDALGRMRGWPSRTRIDTCLRAIAHRLDTSTAPAPSAWQQLSLRPMRIVWRTLHACASYRQRNVLRGPVASILIPRVMTRIHDALETLCTHAGDAQRAGALARSFRLAQQHAQLDPGTLADLLDATEAGDRTRQWAERFPLAFAIALDTGTWHDPIRGLVADGAPDRDTLAPMRQTLEASIDDASPSEAHRIGIRRLRAIAATPPAWRQRLQRLHDEVVTTQGHRSPVRVARAVSRTGRRMPTPEHTAVAERAARLRTVCATSRDLAALRRALRAWVERILAGDEPLRVHHPAKGRKRRGHRPKPTPIEREQRRYGPTLRATPRRIALVEIALIEALDRAERDIRNKAGQAWKHGADSVDIYLRDNQGHTVWPRYVRTCRAWLHEGQRQLAAAVDAVIVARHHTIEWTTPAPERLSQGWEVEAVSSYGALADTAACMENCTSTMLNSMLDPDRLPHLYLITGPDRSRTQALVQRTDRGPWKLAQIEGPARGGAPHAHRVMGRAVARWLDERRKATPWHDAVDAGTRQGAMSQRRLVHEQLAALASGNGPPDPEIRNVTRKALHAALPELARMCEDQNRQRMEGSAQ